MNDEPEIPFEALEPEPPWEAIGNRVCAEPMPMAHMIAALRDGPMMKGLPEPNDAQHPYEGKCRMCGAELDVKWRQLDRCEGWFPINCHDACVPSYYASIGTAAIQGEQWQKLCPPEFRQPWDQKKGNAALLRRVLSYDYKAKPGLLIHGESGSCKTRAAWQLVRQLLENAMQVSFAASIDLPDENMREMMNVQCLVIDDLGNDRMQSSKEALVLKILRHRLDWKKPTIITTQFNGAKLAERFSDGNTAQAVIRRLREYCDDVAA